MVKVFQQGFPSRSSKFSVVLPLYYVSSNFPPPSLFTAHLTY